MNNMNKLINLNQTIDILLLIYSILSTLGYFTYFLVKYKFIPSSLSATTKYLEQSENNEKDREWLFSLFITNISVPLALIDGTILGIVSGSCLWVIALFTGYNNWLKKWYINYYTDKLPDAIYLLAKDTIIKMANKWEDIIHVIFTNLAIGGIIIILIVNWIKNSIDLNFIIVVWFIAFTLVFLIEKIKNHTTWIEIFALFGMGYFGLFLNNIL